MIQPRTPTLPNLIIIGAGKAGTTSLHHYLSLHPQIFMSKRKELSFFDEEMRWKLGLDWYKSQFDASYPVNGESSPCYTRFPLTRGVPERISRVLGTPKLIYMVRDPIDRILSEHTQNVDDWGIPSFDKILHGIESNTLGFIQLSSYHMQISQYLEVFPRESLHIVVLERLMSEPRDTFRELFRFIGVDEQFWSPAFERRYNVGTAKRRSSAWFDHWAPRVVKQQLRRRTWMPWHAKRLLYALSRWGGEYIEKPRLRAEEDLRLQGMLKSDVERLRKFMDDPLHEWRPYA